MLAPLTRMSSALTVFRRRIKIATRATDSGGEVRAVLEDDFHHFRVTVRHRDGLVTAVTGASPRHPFSSCPMASDQLARLRGMALNPVANHVTRVTDPRDQCTHQFDLAGLAIAAAARRIARRGYDIIVPRRVDGRTCARLDRDGAALLTWDVRDTALAGPPPYTNISLHEGFARWAFATLSEDEAEAALVLRRCVMISLGRAKNIDLERNARSTGRCFVQQPERAPHALRMLGSTWDFSDRSDALCADDREWLEFAEDDPQQSGSMLT